MLSVSAFVGTGCKLLESIGRMNLIKEKILKVRENNTGPFPHMHLILAVRTLAIYSSY